MWSGTALPWALTAADTSALSLCLMLSLLLSFHSSLLHLLQSLHPFLQSPVTLLCPAPGLYPHFSVKLEFEINLPLSLLTSCLSLIVLPAILNISSLSLQLSSSLICALLCFSSHAPLILSAQFFHPTVHLLCSTYLVSTTLPLISHCPFFSISIVCVLSVCLICEHTNIMQILDLHIYSLYVHICLYISLSFHLSLCLLL